MKASDYRHASAVLQQGNSHWYPLDRGLDGPQGCGEENDLFPLLGLEPRPLGRSARCLVAIGPELLTTLQKLAQTFKNKTVTVQRQLFRPDEGTYASLSKYGLLLEKWIAQFVWGVSYKV
jgi:hypothetical protein